jgi:hypothetical protein
MLNQRPRITQSGSAAAKDLTADLKLTCYPRSLAATLAAFPSVYSESFREQAGVACRITGRVAASEENVRNAAYRQRDAKEL